MIMNWTSIAAAAASHYIQHRHTHTGYHVAASTHTLLYMHTHSSDHLLDLVKQTGHVLFSHLNLLISIKPSWNSIFIHLVFWIIHLYKCMNTTKATILPPPPPPPKTHLSSFVTFRLHSNQMDWLTYNVSALATSNNKFNRKERNVRCAPNLHMYNTHHTTK